MVCSSLRSLAQVDIPIGTGTASNTDWNYPCPLQDMNDASRMQFLYKASELTAAGMSAGTINAIRFTITDLGMYVNLPTTAVDNLNIKIGTTATNSLGNTTWEPGTQLVYSNIQYTQVLGVNSFVFTQPFFWNGVDNIIIEICTDASNGNTHLSNPYVTYTTGLTFNGSHTIADNYIGNYCNKNSGGSPQGDQTTRPNIIFNWTLANPCTSGSLTAGNAVADKATVCVNESFKLQLTGSSMATGLSYQWQFSTDGTNFTDINGATAAAVTVTQSVSRWYRAIVTCNTGGTAISGRVQVLTPLPVAGTYTIDKSLSSGGNNFQSFNDAYNFIRCGINGPIVFNVAANSGTYNEQLILNNVPGASAANTITFNGAAGAAIEYASISQDERTVIKLNNADHFIFNNLTVNATGSYAYGFQLLNDADSNVINKCNVNTNTTSTSDNYAGIVVNGSNNGSPTQELASQCDWNVFKENVITGGNYGITLVGSSSLPNGNNKILHNTFNDFGLYGIYVACSFNTQIDSNVIVRPVRSTDFSTVYGISVKNINTRLTISRNTITHIFDGGAPYATFYGIYFSSAASVSGLENNISNNLIYGINGGGTVYGIYNELSHNALYYNNTILLDGDGTDAAIDKTNQVAGFYQAGATGLLLYNNNIAVTRSGQATNTAIWFASFSSDNRSNNNNLYITPGTGVRRIGFINGNSQLLLNEWVTASTQDNNSISADPAFVDVTTGNLRPGNVALNNMGYTGTGVTIDITGATRNSPPDVGAFEINPPICTTPPTPGTLQLNPSAACVGTTVTIGLSGNSTGAAQTYQLESSANASTGFTPVGVPSTNPVFFITATTTKYYRITVSCSGNNASTPAVQLTVYQAFPSNTYTINKNAPASATNFVSFNAAYQALACGIAGPIVFNVEPNSGPYNEQLIMETIKGSSVTNTVTFNGNGNTIQFSSNNDLERAVIKFRSTDHVTFDNLVIDATGSGSYGYGVQLLQDADSNTIKNCTIKANMVSGDYAGVVISNLDNDPLALGDTHCDGTLLSGNTISGGNYGITIAGEAYYTSTYSNFIYDNKVINNTITDFNDEGIHIIGTMNTVVDGNTLSRPTRTAVGNFYGIYTDQTNANMKITRNKITNPFGGVPNSSASFYGIYANYSGHEIKNTVANNIIYGVTGEGTWYGIYMNSGGFFNFYHNTISFDSKTTTNANTASASGFYITSAGDGIEFKNNIITITRTGTGYKYGFNVSSGDVVPLTIDYNDYYINGPGGNNFTGYRNGNRVALAEWQTVTNRDQHSISVDPIYSDLAAGNLTPTIAPVNDKGQPVGITNDIDNKVRNLTTPDIGAYEFAPKPCISGVLAGTAIATPNSGICMGATIVLSLNGNTTSGYQIYRWQKAASATGPWSFISDTSYVPEYKFQATGSDYFRCVVVCTGIADTSRVAHITLNAALPAGIYTINNSGGGNFNNFTSAVNALQCGIDGNVIFDVAPGTYNEQVYINRIPGAGPNSRVTFRSANGTAASVILTAAGTTTNNYVLKLDSASFITFKGITISATGAGFGRVVEIAGTSSYDTVANNIITTLATNQTSTNRTAVFAGSLKTESMVISGNNITNGAHGIYVAGTSINRNKNIVIEGNAVRGFYQYGIYTNYCNNTRITGNDITVAAPAASNVYGINTGNNDSTYAVLSNNIIINNSNRTSYGILVSNSNSLLSVAGKIEGNKVIGVTGNTGILYGINVGTSKNSRIVNNVISVKTNGTTSYGLYCNSNIGAVAYNNTVINTSTSPTNNYVAYFIDNSSNDMAYVDVRNNIFSQEGGGKVMFVNRPDRMYSDYNMLYTTGAALVEQDWTGDFASLADWQAAGDLDKHSIVYKPAYLSITDPQPNVNAADVWAMHGRGIQLPGNDHDFNNNTRPVSLKAGVPDLGAYEFIPVATPPVCTATPATPVANSQQVFKLGTDVVTTINWGASVPTSVAVKRYSGVMPAGYTGNDYMYFYTDVAVTGGTYTGEINQNYLDPWRGYIDNEERIRLGKTDVSNNWTIDATSTVNSVDNVIAQTGLTYLGRFTGLTNGTVPYPSTDSVHHDTTNMGTRFWVGYGHNYYVSDFVAKVGGAAQDANVTVKIHGTDWVRHYFVPANTFVTSDPIPRNGASGAVLMTEGLSDRGISIESDVPVAAYVEANGILPVTGSTMLLPVSSYGYEYYALAWKQKNIDIDLNIFSWMYVVADHDSTLVEITPSAPTYGGRAPKVPFVITLNKGEVYQLFGAIATQDDCYDLAGTKVRSLSNTSGKCYPVGVFSGNSYAYVDCSERFNPSGAYLIQQALPAETWGTKYVTMPTSVYGDATVAQTNFYRILVKDPNTTVRKNGQVISPINNFYEYQSNTADYIEADKPITVAQFIPGQSVTCNYGTSTGPEMFYLPSIDQGIKKAVFYRSSTSTFWDNFISLVIPNGGLNSLTIDGSNLFDATYPHPNKPGYSIVVKRWHNAAGNSAVQSDSAFIALSYSLSSGPNTGGVLVGRTVPGIPAQPGITNVYDSSGHFSAFTCVGSPFTYSVLLPIVPTRINWKFSQGVGMVPNADSVQVNPVPTGTVLVNGVSYYRFALNSTYVFNTPGQYTVPVEYVHPIFASCTNSEEAILTVTVAPTPLVNINFNATGCAGDTVYMSTTLTASYGDVARLLTWDFGDNTSATALTPGKLYAGGGNYTVKVDVITNAGCIANATSPIALAGAAPFTFVSDTTKGCDGTDVLLAVKNPQTGVLYNWYNAATGGSSVNTGSSITITAIKATRTYYVDATLGSCTIRPRKAVTALYLGGATPPVVSVDSVGAQVLRFKWTAVSGVIGYEVSLDGGINWSKPSSGTLGLEHLVTGLQPGQTVNIRVKAIDPNNCKDGITEASATTVVQGVFAPNAFTPNGDRLNNEFKIEGYSIKDIQLRIFNQWGEMIFESADKSRGWDGTYKGKMQPSGVYMYVCSITLTDGSKVVKKGSVNLVR